jgi:hypothetical protein
MKKYSLPFQIDAGLAIRIIIISLLILVLIGGCTTSHRATPVKNLTTPPPQSTLAQTIKITPTPTPDLPPNWDDSGEQTNGIVLVGVLLVMIVVIGTYSGIRRPT